MSTSGTGYVAGGGLAATPDTPKPLFSGGVALCRLQCVNLGGAAVGVFAHSVVLPRLQERWTPLHYAESVQAVELLVAAGAPVNACTTSGETPLVQAATCNRVEVIRALLRAGADPRHSYGPFRLTAGHVARLNGFTEVLAVLAPFDTSPRVGPGSFRSKVALMHSMTGRSASLDSAHASPSNPQPPQPTRIRLAGRIGDAHEGVSDATRGRSGQSHDSSVSFSVGQPLPALTLGSKSSHRSRRKRAGGESDDFINAKVVADPDDIVFAAPRNAGSVVVDFKGPKLNGNPAASNVTKA